MHHKHLRALLALLVVLGFLSVAIAAVSPGHLHTTQKVHSCGVCQLSLTPFTTAFAGPVVWPPSISDSGAALQPAARFTEAVVTSCTSRGPPAA